MKYNLKKVATVFASALMLGSTAGLALAANYPAPFVSNGAANVAVVVGSASGADDGAAALDIAEDLSSALAGSTGSSSSKTITGGDAVLIEKSSTKWQLGDTLSEVRSTDLDDNDMETLLADGTYTDDDNEEYDYKQSISPANPKLELFDNDDYKDDSPTIGLQFKDSAEVLNYTIDFTEEPLFTVLETTDLPIMKKNYYVLSVGSNNDSITLLDSAVDTELNEGESTSLTVGDNTYDISARITSGTEVKLTVNGETTKTLSERQTYKLSDGSYVGVKDISYNSKESGVSSVEFSIGKGKLILTNNDEVQMNDEDIDNLIAHITDNSGKLGEITLQWKADNDLFVADDSEIVMPGFESVKMSFGGMVFPAEEKIVVTVDGDDNIYLKDFPTKYDDGEDVYLLQNVSGFTIIGKDDNNKLATGAQNVNVTFTEGTHDYFILSYKSGDDAESYFVRATNFDDSTTPDQVDFEYLSEGSWKSLDTAVVAGDDVTLGSAEFEVTYVSNEASKTVYINVSGNNYLDKLYSVEGLQVQLPYTDYTNSSTSAGAMWANKTYSSFDIVFKEEDKDDTIANGGTVTVSIGVDSDDEVYVTGVTTTDTNGATVSAAEIGNTDVYLDYVYSDLATKVEDDRSGDHETVTLTYHGAEVYGKVYITDVSAQFDSEGNDPESLGIMTITDTEAAASTKNLIVIGGSCVNSLAADLLGVSAGSCGSASGLVSGQAMIKSFARTGGKVAVLIAGYEKSDTAKAATFAINNDWDSSSVDLKLSTATAATTVLS